METAKENFEPRNFIEELILEDMQRSPVVKTRFPPEPNGYLHIGHAKSICINFGIARQYGGKCNLRFDDTNPTKEDVEFVDSIKEDIRWLGFSWDAEYYASDYFDQIYEFALKLIRENPEYLSVLPRYTARRRAEEGRLAILPVTDCHMEQWSQLVHHRDKVLTPQIRAMVSVLAQVENIPLHLGD